MPPTPPPIADGHCFGVRDGRGPSVPAVHLSITPSAGIPHSHAVLMRPTHRAETPG